MNLKQSPLPLFAASALLLAGVNNSRGSESAPQYEIAFASFGPVNAEVLIADADGRNAQPWLPHAGFDGNASFSRDGAWIIFTSEREGSYDIYRAHRDGSALERLVDDPAYDDQGALSPDGTQLAFVSSRTGQADIWLLDLRTRALRNLTNHPAGDFRPAWSPDGQWIAFSSDRDSSHPKGNGGFEVAQSTEIYVMRVDGTSVRRLPHSQAFVGSPTWSADGRYLLVYQAEMTEVRKISGARRLPGTSQIARLELATGALQILTSGDGEKWSPHELHSGDVGYCSGGATGGIERTNGGAGARGEFRCPDWSADGRSLVFHREVDHNWPPVQRWHTRDERFQLLRTGIFPNFSPVADRLLCNNQTAGILHNDITIMNCDGTHRAVIFHDQEKSALGPVWSPQGDRIACAFGQFFQTVKGPAIADIVTLRPDGTGVNVLTDGSGNFGFPSWSPDGQSIVCRASGPQKRGLFIINATSGAMRELVTGSAYDNFPTWSPRGDRIAFTSNRDGDYELYSIRPDGTELIRLTNSPGNDAHSAWSPDGEYIAFTSGRGGFKDEGLLHPYNPQGYGEIYVMRADGSEVLQLTDNPFEEGTVAWAPLRKRTAK